MTSASGGIDPVTFEILRHRLITIAREGAIALRNVSGSPTVALSNDCNVALLNDSGEAVIVGPTIVTHALACGYACDYIASKFEENPGIASGDMFLTNDPYVSTPHQTCSVVVSPVFSEDERIGWTGAGIHVADAGGSTPGQVALGAQSIWDEGPPLPPVKIVQKGELRSDIEGDWLSRSRTPAQNAIDLRAKIAANTVMQRRIEELCKRYGAQTIRSVFDRIVTSVEMQLRSILSDIPDGVWSEETYLDYFDQDQTDLYVCRLSMTKRGGTLFFDFSGSSKQAPGVINVTRPALEGYVIRALMATFGYAIPPCPAGVARVIEIDAEKGTFVDCSFPAGTSKGTTSGTYAVFHAVTSCVSKMLVAGGMPERAITTWRAHMPLLDFAAIGVTGRRFAGVFTDGGLGQGSGARGTQDGIDTGSGSEPEVTVPNVETNELRYPWLYLFRRQAIDSAGAGFFRGGAGIEIALIPHGVEEIGSIVLHSHGTECPSSPPFEGGLPGSVNEVSFLRGSSIMKLMKQGVLTSAFSELGGTREIPKPFGRTRLEGSDILYCRGAGGSGWGDPLDRDPEMVWGDVVAGTLSVNAAKALYGIVGSTESGIDAPATRLERSAQLQSRLCAPLFKPKNVLTRALPAICSGCKTPLHDSNIHVIEIPWEQLGNGLSSLADHKQFHLVGRLCGTCGRLFDTYSYLPTERGVPGLTETQLDRGFGG